MKAKYFDRYGNEVDQRHACDDHGALRNGCTMRVPFQAHDGLSTTQLAVRDRCGFQLPTILAPIAAPNPISVRRDRPRHITMFPGGGSLARARYPPNLAILIKYGERVFRREAAWASSFTRWSSSSISVSVKAALGSAVG